MSGSHTLELPFRPPYPWPCMLSFLGARAIPGVEAVVGEKEIFMDNHFVEVRGAKDEKIVDETFVVEKVQDSSLRHSISRRIGVQGGRRGMFSNVDTAGFVPIGDSDCVKEDAAVA